MSDLLASIKEISRLFMVGCLVVLLIALTREKRPDLKKLMNRLECIDSIMQHPATVNRKTRQANSADFLNHAGVKNAFYKTFSRQRARCLRFKQHFLDKNVFGQQQSFLFDVSQNIIPKYAMTVGIKDTTKTYSFLSVYRKKGFFMPSNPKLSCKSVLDFLRNSYSLNYCISYVDVDSLERLLDERIRQNPANYIGKYLLLNFPYITSNDSLEPFDGAPDFSIDMFAYPSFGYNGYTTYNPDYLGPITVPLKIVEISSTSLKDYYRLFSRLDTNRINRMEGLCATRLMTQR